MGSTSIGERISKLRINSGLTQKELGDKLNITAQAVSKWENGLSEPDIETLKRLSVIFGISISELIDEEPQSEAATAQAAATPNTEQATAEATAEQNPDESVAEQAVTRIINGYCDSCKKPVGPGEYIVESGMGWQRVYCHECKKKMDHASKVSAVCDHEKETKRSLIFGSIAGVVALALSLVFFLTLGDGFPIGAGIGISIVFGLAYFTFIGQMFWDGVINDMFFDIFLKSFKMPGVIFTLDLDGLLALIFIKIGFAFLSIFLSIAWFLIGVLLIIPITSLVVYPFALIKHIHTGKKLKAEVKESEAQLA